MKGRALTGILMILAVAVTSAGAAGSISDSFWNWVKPDRTDASKDGAAFSQSPAVSFTSTQSGSWNNSATWGGAGIPGNGDDVTIGSGHTVTLDANRGANNLTINPGGTLDLAGFELNYSGHNVIFTNNGTLANSGAFNRVFCSNGGANQTLAGNGTYSGNLKLQNSNLFWIIAPGATFNFNSAGNVVNIQIDNGAVNTTNPMIVTAPAAGSYVILEKQAGNIFGDGGIRTQGNVRFKALSTVTVPVRTVSGTGQAEGTFTTGWTVDAGATLALSSGLTVSNLNGGSGLTIANGAAVDLAGFQLNIAGNAPFSNNGSVNNSGAANRIVFMDNGTHTVSGTGNYGGSVGIEAFNGTTNIAAGTSLTFGAPAGGTNIQVDPGAVLNFNGNGALTLSGSVQNNGTINLNSGSTGCGAAIKIRSNVAGTQRGWIGNAMSMTGIDAKDQAGSASVSVAGGLNSGNNGANWNFVSTCIRSRADFDGDGKTDLSVIRASEGNWYLNRSTAGLSVLRWGISGDVAVPGDYDGDGITDTAVFRPDANSANPDYYILRSSTLTISGASWGLPGDIPVTGDFDGDGKTDPAVFRPSNSIWYIVNSSNGSSTIAQFGQSGDIPLSMDNDGDGKSNLAVFRPGNTTWYLARNTGIPAQNFDAVPFGLASDKLVPADYDGDGKDDIAVFRPTNGIWYILRSTNQSVDYTQFGISTDVPVPGDYDGDGKDDIAVYRNGTWYVARSTAGLLVATFGIASDYPVPKAYMP